MGLVCVDNGAGESELDFDTIAQLADRALYDAKEAGRNRVRTV